MGHKKFFSTPETSAHGIDCPVTIATPYGTVQIYLSVSSCPSCSKSLCPPTLWFSHRLLRGCVLIGQETYQSVHNHLFCLYQQLTEVSIIIGTPWRTLLGSFLASALLRKSFIRRLLRCKYSSKHIFFLLMRLQMCAF